MAKKTQRKGFSFLSFLLGILFGMILLIGAVAGVGWYILSTDVDKAFEFVGMENKDEDGNYVYINSDVETGGAKNLLDLVSKVMNMTENVSELSVSEVEGLIPAISGVVDGLYETVNQFVPFDRAEFADVKFASIGEFVQTKVMDIQPATLFENLGMEGFVDNKIMSLVFLGREADYVINGDVKYPVYYDLFNYENNEYKRVGDDSQLDNKYIENLVSSGEQYRLYYYTAGDNCYITDENFTFVNANSRTAVGEVYEAYNPEYASLTGNYYRNGEERIVVNPITVGDFADGTFDMLNDVYLSDLLADDNELAEKILGGISMGDIMSNGVDFNAVLNDLPLADLVKTKVTDGVMASLVWNIKNIEANEGDSYTYTGIYTVDDIEYTCYIQTELNDEGALVISSAYYSDGEKNVEISSITVGDLMNGFGVEDILNDMTIADFMDIKAAEPIMAYLGYEVYDVTADGDGYVAKYDLSETETVTCYISVDGNGVITACYYLNGASERIHIKSAGINDISGRISGVTHKLTLGELIGETDDPIINKLGKYTIDNVSAGINELKLSDLMEISEDNLLFYNLRNETVGSLPTAISNLTINDIYAEEIYKVKTDEKDEDGNDVYIEATIKRAVASATPADGQITFSEKYIYYTKTEEGYSLVNIEGNKIGKLTAAQFAQGSLGETYYYTYGEAQGVWSMLLEVDGSEVAYTLNNLTDMIENVSNNMQNAKLRELHEAGILTFTQPDKLNNTLPYYDNGVLKESPPIGEMALMDFINFIINNVSRPAN